MKKLISVFVLTGVNAIAAGNCRVYFEKLNRLNLESQQPSITSFSETAVSKIRLVEKTLSLKGYTFVQDPKDSDYELTYRTIDYRDIDNYPARTAVIDLKETATGVTNSFYKSSGTKLLSGPMKEYPLLFWTALGVGGCKK